MKMKNLLLLDKKPGLLVHPDEHYHFDSLIARIQHHLYDKKEYRPDEENSFAPALVNRIDRNTGGIVIAAKNAETLRILNDKMKHRELEKKYLCIVHGRLKKKEDTLIAYLEKKESQNRVYISHKPTDQTKTIRTRYRVLKEQGDYSLLEVDFADRAYAPNPRPSSFHRAPTGWGRQIRLQCPEQTNWLEIPSLTFLQIKILLHLPCWSPRISQRKRIRVSQYLVFERMGAIFMEKK